MLNCAAASLWDPISLLPFLNEPKLLCYFSIWNFRVFSSNICLSVLKPPGIHLTGWHWETLGPVQPLLGGWQASDPGLVSGLI